MQAEGSTQSATGQQFSSGDRPRGSVLRERMIDQMIERGLAEATRAVYVRGVLGLVEHYDGRKPEDISVVEARRYVAGLKDSDISDTARSHASAGIRFLYETTLGQDWRPISPLRKRMIEDAPSPVATAAQAWSCAASRPRRSSRTSAQSRGWHGFITAVPRR